MSMTPVMKAVGQGPALELRQNCLRPGVRALALAVLVAVVLMGQAASSEGAQRQAPAGRATVKRDGVLVYAGMSPGSKVVKSLKQGDQVTIDLAITGAEGAWCSISEVGQTIGLGYVRCEDLDREPPPRWRERRRRPRKSETVPSADVASASQATRA